MPIFEWRSVMPVPVDEVFAYHARPGAFERLAPPWQKLRVLEESGDVTARARRLRGLVRARSSGTGWPRWAATWRAGSSSTVRWRGRSPRGSTRTASCPSTTGTSELLDHVEYSLPAGGLTDAVGEGAGRQAARAPLPLPPRAHARSTSERHAVWADRPRLKVAITGASGLIGSHLAVYLTTAGPRGRQAGAARAAGAGRSPLGPGRRALYRRRASPAWTPSSTSPA